jgi:hypothetical protein
MFTEDLSAFFSTADFAVAATHGGTDKNVIFEKSYLESLGVQSSKPAALGRKSDWLAVEQGDTVVIGAVSYVVAEFHHDPPDMPDLTLIELAV